MAILKKMNNPMQEIFEILVEELILSQITIEIITNIPIVKDGKSRNKKKDHL